ncbi:hypothetical protein DJ010_05740 [Nocardioides silvaticus]|uniref:SalK n=1 Tax=Nocardioides silvaticus TaxID=2201891 RepID=A0A316TN55_9ACTN|nr:hypothetical protein [Nocardioides silvaticus]PWN03604.1 hypothetical protein DJ010_05740 [Nocardioides silvaticus]
MPRTTPTQARRLWTLLEPVHAVTYFSPEPLSELKAAGYRGFWMGYFAGRAAPLGPVNAEVVRAAFYNFAPDHVARALPDAWAFAPPQSALDARRTGSAAALRRQLGVIGDDPTVALAADLAAKAARSAPLDGRVLFAANRSLPEPDDPVERLWHAATLLREHRGDGHVAALVTAGVGGRESHVLHALAAGTGRDVYELARTMQEVEWTALLDGLRDRGLVDGPGGLTDAGRELKDRVEQLTDELAAPAYDVLGGEEVDALVDALRPITRAVIAAGDIPSRSPMGLDLDQV